MSFLAIPIVGLGVFVELARRNFKQGSHTGLHDLFEFLRALGWGLSIGEKALLPGRAGSSPLFSFAIPFFFSATPHQPVVWGQDVA
jgi:hypothetical protein